jgi:hypothetical protein
MTGQCAIANWNDYNSGSDNHYLVVFLHMDLRLRGDDAGASCKKIMPNEYRRLMAANEMTINPIRFFCYALNTLSP